METKGDTGWFEGELAYGSRVEILSLQMVNASYVGIQMVMLLGRF